MGGYRRVAAMCRPPCGVRQRGLVVVLIAGCARSGRSRSALVRAVAEWVADLPDEVTAALGTAVRCRGGSTIRRVLGVGRGDRRVHPAPVCGDRTSRAAAGPGHGWQHRARLPSRRCRGPAPGRGDRDKQTRTVLGQIEVAGKTNEITAFAPLLDTLTSMDLTGAVLTADAPTQREHIADLRARGARTRS